MILLKLGGSIITEKRSDKPVLNRNLSRIASEISSYKGDLIIVHGAGSYGHPIASKFKLAEGLTADNASAFAQCQAQMNELNQLVCRELGRSIRAFPFQLSASSVSENRIVKAINVNLLQRMLKQGLVPVLYGTPIVDIKQGCAIISGDQIISKLSLLMQPEKIIFATNVDGIYDKNPSKKDAKIISSLDAQQLRNLEADESRDADVTQGMKGKLKWIAELSNVKVQIINGNTPGNIKETLSGNESIGTVVKL